MTRRNNYMDRALRHRDSRYAVILGRLGYATRHMERGPETAVEDDDLSDLRAAYREAVGKQPYHGWDAEELQRRIDEAVDS